MTEAIKCNRCGKFTDDTDAMSLAYDFVRAFGSVRKNRAGSGLNTFDMCVECSNLVMPDFLERLKK